MRTFTQTLKFFFLTCALVLASNALGQTYNGSTWYSLYDHPSNQNDGYKNTDKTFDVYAPTTKSCTFEWKKTGQFFGYPGCDIYISQSTNGGSSYGDENHAIASPVTTKQDSWKEKTVSVEENFNKIKFRQGGTLSRHFKNVTIPLAKHIRLVSGTYGTTSVTKNFENVEWGTYKSYKVNFRSFLTNGNITVSIVGDDKGDFSFSSTTHGVHTLAKSDKNRSFSVGANMCASENGAANTACSTGVLGSASEYNFTVYYYPKKENVGRSYTGNTVYVNITDGKSTAKVILRGNCVKRNQTIVWDNSAATYNTTDNITYNAVANDAISGTASGVSVTYAPTSGSPAYMSGNALQIVTSGNTTITASAAANTYYNAATNVNKKITINKVTPTVTWPEIASGLKYNESCAVGDKVSDHWTGGSAKDDKNTPVSGTFVCDAALVPANTSYSVTFNPTKTNWYNSVSTTISGVVAKGDQTIDWPLADATTNPATEYATGQLIGATATSGLPITYTSSNNAWGYINENGRLVVVVPNKEITIRANQGGNDNWNEAPERTMTFTTKGANPNQTTEVHASNITYGQTLSASTLSGDVKLDGVVIAGTLSWVDPAIMPNAGTANHMALFTPDNTDAYSPIYFEVPVTVAKATPVITWNITNILREGVRYDHFVESSNKEQSFSVSSPSSLLTISGTTLYTENVDSKQTGLKITFTQSASANYNAVSETKTVAIYPRAGICLPFEPMTESDYNQAGVAHNGNVNWCNTDAEGSEKWLDFYTVRFTQYKGIAIGSWQGGFNYDEKYIDLFFSGIPENISFKAYLQTVTTSEHVHWPATAGVVTVMESEDGSTFTTVGDPFNASSSGVSFSDTLKSETRYVRLIYSGNFTCYFQNVNITQKKYLREKNNKSELVFGTEANPLQQPQVLTLSYSSLGVCGGTADNITVSSSNPAFYVDETTITENVGVELKGEYVVRVRCNDVNQSGVLTFRSNDGTELKINVRSTNPYITTAATAIFETGTEYASVSASYRALRTHDFSACFDGAQAKFDTLYIYGVSESSATDRQWVYDASKKYKVPAVSASNVHTPCFVYKKDGAQYTYVRTFDAATTTLDVADTKTRVLVGYRPESPATTALQLGMGAAVNLNNTEIVATNAAVVVNGNATIAARGANIISSASKAAVQLAGTTTLAINDSWKSGETSGILALRPASGYPSIDLGSATGRVVINGTQLELHNATNDSQKNTRMAIAHMSGTTMLFDGEVQINDGSIGGEEILGMPKLTFIDGGTFNDGRVDAYTLKGVAKRPRNSRGEMVSRHTMSPAALAAGYSWYGQTHLTPDGSAKVNPMLMDEEVWIFNGTNSDHSDDATSWNKESVPGETADVLINAPIVISGGELKVKSLTINWVDNGKGIPAVTVNPDGGLTVGDGGIDGIKVNMVNNLALKAGAEGATKGQTGFLRIHPNSAEPMPAATVELYTKAYYDMNATDHNEEGKWQFIGYPLTDGANAKKVFPKSWLYNWDAETEEWKNNRKTLSLQPFEGYATSQLTYEEGMLLTFAGPLVQNVDKVINLSHNEGSEFTHNMVANSYSAPIDVTKFEDTDFDNMQAAVYIFNTGSRADIKNLSDAKSGDCNIAGQYLSIPIGSARAMKGAFETPTIIAPMQGFCVHATGENAQLRLDYEKLVWNGDYATNKNEPLHINARKQEAEQVNSLCVSLYGEGVADNLYMLESDQYDAAFENGYDAKKMNSGEANIFSVEGDDHLAVDATSSLIGTQIGVRTGDTTAYVLVFTHLNSERPLALLDNETNETIDINEGTEYTFFAVPNSEVKGRFFIVESANAPTVTTGIEETNSGVRAQKFIKDGQLYILKNGVLYTATGAVVR